MIRVSARRLLLSQLGSTKLGAEVLQKTRRDMKNLETKDNIIIRFLTRRRPVDYLAMEVDGPISRELDPHFSYAKSAFTFLLCAPVFTLLFAGYLQPTYYMLVPTGIMPVAKYEQMWSFSHRAVVGVAQALFCVILYDLSVYIRYPFFLKVLAPFYRRMGYMRTAPPTANLTLEQLRSGAHKRHTAARPLGRPLGEVRREMKKDSVSQHPFGRGTPGQY